MKKFKVKEFVANHKDEIIGFATIAGCVAIGVAIGRKLEYEEITSKYFVVKDEPTAKILNSAYELGKIGIFTGSKSTPIKPENLGELGEEIIRCGGGEHGFTHFIAIGKDLVTEE